MRIMMALVVVAGFFSAVSACKKSSSSSGGGPAPVQASTATYSLAITVVGNGTVISAPAGITASTTTASFVSGTPVTLTATANSGSYFSGWSGGGCTGIGTCVVTMSTTQTVTATFLAGYTLTVAVTGSNSGTVTSSPVGINCGSTCAANYTANTQVTLTAIAASPSTFSGWSGGGCAGIGTCVVTMNSNQNISATFVPHGSQSFSSNGVFVAPSGVASVTVQANQEWLVDFVSVRISREPKR